MIKNNQNMHNIKEYFFATVQQFQEATWLTKEQREEMVPLEPLQID